MAEPATVFPLEIYYHLVSQIYLEKATLSTLSLVSSQLRDLAQQQLFKTVVFHYPSALSHPTAPRSFLVVNLGPYKAKVHSICSSTHLCKYIQELQITFCNLKPWALPHSKGSDKVFCKEMEEVARTLPRMIALRRLSYRAPLLFGAMHQAILCHPSLKTLLITPLTSCEKPCREASEQHDRGHALQELEILEWSPYHHIQGLSSPVIGARQCALTSNILVTHSSSLHLLRVPVLLLFDAISAVSSFPRFPHLRGLSIMPSGHSPNMNRIRPVIADKIEQFLLHVHETIVFLDWSPEVSLKILERLPQSCFPNLDTLEGEEIECLLSNHPLRRLCLAIPNDDNDLNFGSLQALYDCKSTSPNLEVLLLEPAMHTLAYTPAISEFASLKTFIYRVPLPPSSGVNFEELQVEPFSISNPTLSVISKFLSRFVPNMPFLHTVSVELWGTDSIESIIVSDVISTVSRIQSNSLRSFIYKVALEESEDEIYQMVFELRRQCSGDREWVALRDKTLEEVYFPCPTHKEQCYMNRPQPVYQSWMTL
ncbi:hypothetical protein M408DRAFT_30268 [Serendipita vermifera MAFF 305830]|uniref:F-box domain-containing protein n=1 Tax=Serendipita vermifera MAFF 305830 TaxID=933852 RepID=A0A0C3A7C4_SERVB|nr:hypothetical protein M408DRAFT_30268 [Serendipita vermifera MAFF 305830]